MTIITFCWRQDNIVLHYTEFPGPKVAHEGLCEGLSRGLCGIREPILFIEVRIPSFLHKIVGLLVVEFRLLGC